MAHESFQFPEQTQVAHASDFQHMMHQSWTHVSHGLGSDLGHSMNPVRNAFWGVVTNPNG